MWFNFWTGGFLAGWLLARVVQLHWLSWSWLAFLLALLMLRRARRYMWLWASVGFCFGSYHNAPFPAQPLSVAHSVQHNALQFFYGNLIVTTAAQERWQVRGYPHSHGSVPKISGQQQHFIFTYPPHLREHTMATPPTLVREPRFYLLRQTNNLGEPVSSWIASITLGKRKGMPRQLQDAFRLLGLFHILVISGLHITIIAVSGKKLIELALRSLYIVRVLTPMTWLVLTKLISLLSCLLILLYGCLVGFSAPAQRAVLLFVTHQGFALWERDALLIEKIKLVLFLQMLLFPIGFLSDSLLLSWGAYLIVLHCFQEVKQAKAVGGKLAALLRTQLIISVLILCFFKQLSLLAIPLNVLLLPLIPYIVMSGFLLLFLPAQTTIAMWIEHSHLFFLQQITRLAEFASTYSWLTFDIGNSPLLRIALFVVLIIIVLSRILFVTKRRMEQD